MQSILLVDSDETTQLAMEKFFAGYELQCAANAASAIVMTNEHTPELIILELTLAGHSGLEFLYELRTYADWQNIPVIIYTSIKLDDEILRSRAWKQLSISDYFYKPESSIEAVSRVAKTYLKVALHHENN